MVSGPYYHQNCVQVLPSQPADNGTILDCHVTVSEPLRSHFAIRFLCKVVGRDAVIQFDYRP